MIPTTGDVLDTVEATELPAEGSSSEVFRQRVAKFALLGILVVLLSPVLLVFCTIPLTVACCLGVPIFGDKSRTRL